MRVRNLGNRGETSFRGVDSRFDVPDEVREQAGVGGGHGPDDRRTARRRGDVCDGDGDPGVRLAAPPLIR